MNQASEATGKPHGISILDRTRATITGVNDVDSFNEQSIVLNTSQGTMTIVGEALHVTKLSLDEGSLLIDGKISAVEYDDHARPAKGKALSRLFK